MLYNTALLYVCVLKKINKLHEISIVIIFCHFHLMEKLKYFESDKMERVLILKT